MKVRFELFRVKQVNLHANIQSSDRTESVVSSVNMLTLSVHEYNFLFSHMKKKEKQEKIPLTVS